MRYFLTIVSLLVVLVAWWATGTTWRAPQAEEQPTTTAIYPPDFDKRLSRVTGVTLQRHAPLPATLHWQTAEEHPGIGSPDARKGGTVSLSNAGPFPAHFLRFGGAVQFFHRNLQQATEIPLLAHHPLTQTATAGVASAWASDGTTVYFKLNPAARYNNGCQVRADDYLFALLLQAEQQCSEFESISACISAAASHGDSLLSVTLRKGADLLDACRLLHAAEPGFYAAFNSRFRENYAQRIPPSTGPYQVKTVQRGRLIVLQRITNWWGEKLPLCRNRFNADALEYHFLTSEAQVWEFLLKGRLDALQTRNISAWQERLAGSDGLRTLVYDAEYPLPPYGIAANARTLPDIHLRRGLMHSMDMDGAMAIMMRGEGRRLTTFSSGYGRLSPANTPQYRYDAESARACFTRAGYTASGGDGILRKPDGTRLCVQLLYTPHEKISNMVSYLAQSAKACGVEILPAPAPWQTCQQRLQERSHELLFWAVPAPDKPNPKLFLDREAAPEFSPFGLESNELQDALEQFEASPTAENLARVDKMVYENAIWLPGWKENRVYLAHHPHLVIPPSPWCFDALDAHLFWVKAAP